MALSALPPNCTFPSLHAAPGVGLGTIVQVLPFQWSTSVMFSNEAFWWLPTAHASLAEAASTARRSQSPEVGLAITCHSGVESARSGGAARVRVTTTAASAAGAPEWSHCTGASCGGAAKSRASLEVG